MKKAFTLVELLGVIIVLGVISLIVFPIVDKSIKTSKEESLNGIIKTIEKAAQEYVVREYMGYTTSYDKVDLDELVAAGYLKDDIVNPVTNEKMTGCVTYKWESEYNQYKYEYQDQCTVKTLIETLLEQYNESNTVGLLKDATNPNLYYYNGTNEQVSNNFLWYGGHQWRVLEFDTEAKTLTLITQQPLANIIPADESWSTVESYNNTYVNNWLNDYFYNSLNYDVKNNILVNTFNIGEFGNVSRLTVNNKVGLLDKEQYIRAGGQNSYLDIKDSWYYGNYYSTGIMYIDAEGAYNHYSSTSQRSRGIRPVIKISDILINNGDGNITSSYNASPKSSNIDTIQVGEYINVPYNGTDNACGSDNLCTFRVVSKDEDSVKITLNGLLNNTSSFGSTATFNSTSTVYSLLDNFYNSLDSIYLYPNEKKYYIGDYEPEASKSSNYTSIFDETTDSKFGLPMIGEMFSGNDFDISTSSTKTFVDVNTIENPSLSYRAWLMNRKDASHVYGIYDNIQYTNADISLTLGIRPTLFLKNNLDFTGGDGTAQSPYTLE